MPKHDIENRQDIELIVNQFYTKVKQDSTIGFMFSHVDWDLHLPVMYDFWDNVLFYSGNYSGNPMAKHQMVNKQYPMTKQHFAKWICLFNATINELYSGKNANLIKERAKSIAAIMELKITDSGMHLS